MILQDNVLINFTGGPVVQGPNFIVSPLKLMDCRKAVLEEASVYKMTVNIHTRNDADLAMGSFCSAQEQTHHNNQPAATSQQWKERME
jgi:hypothetical protein